MSDDAKREGLSDERCDDIALDARERVRGMAAWGMHLDRALIRAGYALAAPASAQTPAGEVAAWECRHFDPQYGWSPWERIEPRHRLETIEGRVNDIREFIKLGNKYQLRALYAEGEPEGYAHE